MQVKFQKWAINCWAHLQKKICMIGEPRLFHSPVWWVHRRTHLKFRRMVVYNYTHTHTHAHTHTHIHTRTHTHTHTHTQTHVYGEVMFGESHGNITGWEHSSQVSVWHSLSLSCVVPLSHRSWDHLPHEMSKTPVDSYVSYAHDNVHICFIELDCAGKLW